MQYNVQIIATRKNPQQKCCLKLCCVILGILPSNVSSLRILVQSASKQILYLLLSIDKVLYLYKAVKIFERNEQKKHSQKQKHYKSHFRSIR
jgi:hypothetical protein